MTTDEAIMYAADKLCQGLTSADVGARLQARGLTAEEAWLACVAGECLAEHRQKEGLR